MPAKSRTKKSEYTAAPLETVHKQCLSQEVKALDDTERTIRFRISTGDVDREKDIVEPTGWRTDEYMKNPVVLFGHDYKSLPVARALSLSADEHGLSMVAQFPTKEVYPFADTVYQMIKGGFLNATSVGFKPVKWNLEPERGGVRYQEQILLEASVVPVPANAAALVEARALGIDTDPIREWAVAVLKATEQPSLLQQEPPVAPAPPEALPAQPSPSTETKAGRVLSGRNESALRESVAALTAAMAQLQQVLSQVEAGQDEDEDDDKPDEQCAAPAEASVITITDTAEVPVTKEALVFRLVEDPEPRISVDPAMVSEAIARAYATSLRPVVEARVDAALLALRGRID